MGVSFIPSSVPEAGPLSQRSEETSHPHRCSTMKWYNEKDVVAQTLYYYVSLVLFFPSISRETISPPPLFSLSRRSSLLPRPRTSDERWRHEGREGRFLKIYQRSWKLSRKQCLESIKFWERIKTLFFFATTIFQNISIVFSTFIKQILYICLSFFKVDLRRKRFINKRSKRSNLNLFDSKSLLCHDRFPKSKIVDRIFCHGHRVNIKNMLAPFFNVPLPSRRYFTYFRARI